MDLQQIPNYRGVMLCNRPNDKIFAQKERPFVSTVHKEEALGLTPPIDNKQQPPPIIQKQVKPALIRHKKWLEQFKLQKEMDKQNELIKKIQYEERSQKMRLISQKNRENTRKLIEDNEKGKQNQQQNQLNNQLDLQTEIPTFKEQTNSILKKEHSKQKNQSIKKPQWAMTENQIELNQDKEEENLINFMQNLDFDSYMNDLEVDVIVKALKQRVKELQQQENWKEKAEKQMKDQEDNVSQHSKNERKIPEDNYDRISQNLNRNDEAKSVASEKTQNSINKIREEQIKQKQGKQDWDKSTTAKPIVVSFEDRIAKHVADEVLRNYKHLGNIHSNTSLRKLLEQEAKKTFKDGNRDVSGTNNQPNAI